MRNKRTQRLNKVINGFQLQLPRAWKPSFLSWQPEKARQAEKSVPFHGPNKEVHFQGQSVTHHYPERQAYSDSHSGDRLPWSRRPGTHTLVETHKWQSRKIARS